MDILPEPIPGFEPETLPWSAKDRDRELGLARSREFDLIILGGGITGAGLAREAALRRISFLLADKGDFASGTSSRSSKLVHGGFRYLAQGEFRLVRQATRERAWLRAALPNLVRPQGFHYCAYAGGPDTPLRVRAGILLYDLLAGALSPFRRAPRRFLSPAELAEREPAADRVGLLMAGVFQDHLVDDARLVLETLLEARHASGGRSLALNYLEAVAIGGAPGDMTVALTDRLGGTGLQVRGRCVVNATGVWADRTLGLAGLASTLIHPSKGVHLVVPNARVGNREAFVLRSLADGRSCFVLRRGEVSLIGTTDTDYPGDPDRPCCDPEDCRYLLNVVNRVFPDARLTPDDVLATSAGIRPLLRGIPGAGEPSRRHAVLASAPGIVTIAGGKLTTFRIMAWEGLARCSRLGYLRRLSGPEARRDFSRRPYRDGVAWEPWLAAAARQGLDRLLPEAATRRLHQQYGRRALAILREVRRDPPSGAPLLEGNPACAAEILHILRFENAPRLADVMQRRTELQMEVGRRRQAELAGRVVRVLAGYYGWSEERAGEELDGYLAGLRETVEPWRN